MVCFQAFLFYSKPLASENMEVFTACVRGDISRRQGFLAFTLPLGLFGLYRNGKGGFIATFVFFVFLHRNRMRGAPTIRRSLTLGEIVKNSLAWNTGNLHFLGPGGKRKASLCPCFSVVVNPRAKM
jgi:hypothetical protein